MLDKTAHQLHGLNRSEVHRSLALHTQERTWQDSLVPLEIKRDSRVSLKIKGKLKRKIRLVKRSHLGGEGLCHSPCFLYHTLHAQSPS